MKIKTYRNIIFSVVYGCETWSLTLRKESWLRVVENRVLRRIFEPKRDEVIGEWRKLHKEELYHSADQAKKNELCGECSTYGGRRSAYRVLVGRNEGKRLLGRPRHKLEDNIKIHLQEGGRRSIDWINLAMDWVRWLAFVNAVVNLRVP
jgi:hypothetical protein